MVAIKHRLARALIPVIQDDHWLQVLFIAMLLVTAILVAGH